MLKYLVTIGTIDWEESRKNEKNTVSDLKDLNFLPLDEKLNETCNELGLLDPMILLVGLANGKDLTATSVLFEWMETHIGENGDKPPDEFDWFDLCQIIKEHMKFTIVDESTKLNAQKTIAEYLHSKKKSLELTDKTVQASITPLSTREIKRFKRVFNKEF